MHEQLSLNSELSIHDKLPSRQAISMNFGTLEVHYKKCARGCVLQTYQNKVPWYMCNEDIHCDFKVPTVAGEIKKVAGKYQKMLETHENVKVHSLHNNNGLVWRLETLKPFELV